MTSQARELQQDEAVRLHLEDGESESQPLARKLGHAFPDLPARDRQALLKVAKDVRSLAFALMARVYSGELPHAQAIDELKTTYPFLSADNIQRLHSLGMYAAWKS